MVKSRRRASAAKSRPNATLAHRPSVSTSSRSVVVSSGRPSMMIVTVPCATPVSATLNPASRARRMTSSGRGGGREVEIDRRLAEREIAHRAADEPGLLALAVERFERSRERALLEERLILELSVRKTRKRDHSKRPGTSTPFSTCAGM